MFYNAKGRLLDDRKMHKRYKRNVKKRKEKHKIIRHLSHHSVRHWLTL